MKTMPRVLAVAVGGVLLAGMASVARAEDRWLHVRVESKEGETVRVNVPLEMAEKLLPTINHGNLHSGKVTISGTEMNCADVRAILEAVKTAPDNEFVTVQSHDADVRVAKSNGSLIVHVLEHQKGDPKKSEQKVEIQVPMKVVEALLSSGKDELDLVAALHALREVGETTLVTVRDGADHVRVWVDTHSEVQ